MVCDPLWPPIARYLKQTAAFNGVKRLVVAVSGGPDSVALLHILKAEGLRTYPEVRLHVAHLNHGLRGSAAIADARFVHTLATQLELPVTIETQDVSAQAKESKRNWEATARMVRYDFLHRVAREAGAQAVATGHTKTDQAETVLMRLIRGTGVDGLGSIQPVQFLKNGNQPETDTIRLIRPLLAVERFEIEAYLKRKQILACHDETNDLIGLTRNQIRHQVMPLLTRLNSNVVDHLAGLAALAHQEADFFKPLVDQWIAQFSVVVAGQVQVPLAELRQLHPVLVGRVIHQLVQQPEFPSANQRQIQQVCEVLVWGKAGGKAIDLPGNRRVRRVRNYLLFERSNNI
ncbi:MAG: tRNA lysidine(34) synthetase TilS [Acidobacteria bacterium]|nr:tRNA lysidine(34) synthetase TilS [Acidobacteriota bacterium]